MNVAALTKLRLLPAISAEALLNYIATINWQERFVGHYETALYLSQHDTQEFYLLNWWRSNEDLEIARERVENAGILSELQTQVKILEHYNFDLIREYRRLPPPIQSSYIRLVTYPDDFPAESLSQMLNSFRQIRLELPDIIGTWVGRRRSKKIVILHRIDWASIEAQQAFLNSTIAEQILERYATEDIISDYPSFNVQLLLEPEPLTKPIS